MHSPFKTLALILSLASLPAPLSAQEKIEQTPAGSSDKTRRTGEDWAEFLGPRRTGVSGETGLLKTWPEEGPPVLWKKSIGSGYTAPSIRGNRLVLFQRVGDEEVVECLEADTGRHVWDYKYPTQFIDPYGYDNGPRCTPLLTPDRCYTFGAEGVLACLNLADGKEVWKRDTCREFDVPEAFFGVGATPILEGNVLVTMVGGHPTSGMVGFDARTGKTLWESVGLKAWKEPRSRYLKDAKLASYSSPMGATVHGERLVFSLMRPGLVVLDPATGEVRCSDFFRATFRESVNAARPLIVDDKVFISAAYDVGAALLKLKPDNRGFEELWRDELAMQNHWSTCIHHEGFLYGFSGRHEAGSTFRCIELNTGKLAWATKDVNADDEPDPKDGRGRTVPKFYGRGSAIMAEGKLIVLGERGLLALVEVNPKKFVEISRVQREELEYPSWVAPVLSRQRLYLRDLNDILCLDLAAPKGK